jgi:hypothetical protein
MIKNVKIGKSILVLAIFMVFTLSFSSERVDAATPQLCKLHSFVAKEGTQGTGYSWSTWDKQEGVSKGFAYGKSYGQVAYKQIKKYRYYFESAYVYYGPYKSNGQFSSLMKDWVFNFPHKHCVQ